MESAACGGHQSYARDVEPAASNETGPVVEIQHQSYARDVEDAASNKTQPIVETQHQSYARNVKIATRSPRKTVIKPLNILNLTDYRGVYQTPL